MHLVRAMSAKVAVILQAVANFTATLISCVLVNDSKKLGIYIEKTNEPPIWAAR
ncbi:unannotated protein [freshwater metagenome]|uniref:Unannotated protein n=1 Tax=freshwater metagenome TaxID=449393 RepID=A0A6J7BEQ0_9ZZZZ